ncbi:MAG: hypothetical protein ACQETL_15755 [Bacteroidota bacterium]
MTNKKDKILMEEAEYGLDSRYKSKKESKSEATALMEARLAKMKNLSKGQIIRAKLMQLKLQMEDYIKQPHSDNSKSFSEFLQSYIDTIYDKRSQFAKDIDITAVRLSQLINNHREPKDEFIRRLMIHSEKVYANICEFNQESWYKVYYHKKLCDTLSTQNEWRPKIEKHVNFSESIEG